jgi:hypothetical protein
MRTSNNSIIYSKKNSVRYSRSKSPVTTSPKASIKNSGNLGMSFSDENSQQEKLLNN